MRPSGPAFLTAPFLRDSVFSQFQGLVQGLFFRRCQCLPDFCTPLWDPFTFTGWGAWEPWRECTATCGMYGTRERKRYCINPVPTENGRKCGGDKSQEEACNRQICPSKYFSQVLMRQTYASCKMFAIVVVLIL